MARNRIRAQKLRFLAELVLSSLTHRMEGRSQPPVIPAPGQLGVTFIGHSSFLVQVAGLSVLIDPVFASWLLVLKRRRRPGLRLAELKAIDAVLLTHAHMDHLNLPSLRRIVRHTRKLGGQAPVAVVPQGVADLVASLGFSQVISLAPWQAVRLRQLSAEPTSEPLDVTLTPGRHWGARLFADTHRGYGGYVLSGEGHCLYHAGDTAYFPGFTEIGARLQPQVALLPIGAYSPDNFRGVHTSPEDALQAFLDLGAETMIPMHYNTFRLSLEPLDEPLPRLLAAATARGVSERVIPLVEGETRLFPARS